MTNPAIFSLNLLCLSFVIALKSDRNLGMVGKG